MEPRRPQWPSRRREVRQLIDELADLVGDLGSAPLPTAADSPGEPDAPEAATAPGPGAPAAAVPDPPAWSASDAVPADAAPAWPAGGEAAGEPFAAGVSTATAEAPAEAPLPWAMQPMWEAAPAHDEEDVVGGLWPAPTVPLADGMRPWSVIAATRPLPPLQPAGVVPAPVVQGHSRAMTVTAAVAMVVAILVIVATRISLVRTPGPDHASVQPNFTVSQMRTVEAATESGVDQAPSTTTFASTVPGIYVVVTFSGAGEGDRLELRVTREAPTAGDQPVGIDDTTYPVTTAGSGVAHFLLHDPQGVPLPPGRYTVTAVHGTRTVGSVAFQVVEVPAPSPAP